MGHVLSREGFSRAIKRIGKTCRIYAPQLKRGEGRFTDVDVVRYDFTDDVDAMELVRRSDYPFKEVLTPLSQTRSTGAFASGCALLSWVVTTARRTASA